MTRTSIMRRCRTDRCLALLLAALVTTPVLGLVHTALRRSEPARGAVLHEAPRQLMLEFTERIALATARVTLRMDSAAVVALSPLRHADSTRRVIAVDVGGPLRAGPYTVEWTVVGTDGHPVRGTVDFTIDSAASGLAPITGPAEPSAATDPSVERPAPPTLGESEALFRGTAIVGAVVRVLTYATILGLIGVAALQAFVIPGASGLDAATRDGLVTRFSRVGIVCVIGLLFVAGLRLVLQTVTLSGGTLDGAVMSGILRDTTWGRAWMWQVAVAAVAGFVLRRQRGRPLLLAACVAIALTASFSGHPVATPDRAAVAMALDTAHVLAAGAWLGSLAVLAVAGIPAAMALAPPTRGAAVWAVFIRFSPMALVCAGVLVLSGAMGALLQLGGFGALFASDYGRVLLVKLGAFGFLVAVAAYNWRRMLPQLEVDGGVSRLRSSVRIELVLAVLVLAVTAVLTVTPPPIAEASIPAP